MKAERVQRAALATNPFLENLSPQRRREVLSTAVESIKAHGAEGLVSDPVPADLHISRATHRQVGRALGWRGSKTKRHNLAKRLPVVQNALAVDAALSAANARMQMGPLEKTRLRVKELSS